MNVLKEEDRKAILTFLFENASDQVLVTAVADCKAERENTRNQFISLTKYIGIGAEKRVETLSPAPKQVTAETVSEVTDPPGEKRVETLSPATKQVTAETVSEVTDPPGEACSKIGANTRATLLARCVRPTRPEHIGRDMYPQMKLLWTRGELSWDGQHYTSTVVSK